MTPFPIGRFRRQIGQGQRVYLAFECGPNHTGFASALQMVRIAAEAGADAAKFQIFDSDRLVGDESLLVRWNAGTDADYMRELLRQRELSPLDWRQVGQACHDLGLDFIATVDYPETLRIALDAGADCLKACSGDLDHLPWLAEMARADVPLMIDTGHGTLGEVERAVDVIQPVNGRLVIHHVPGGYPARLASVCLRVIPSLLALFGDSTPIAFSDHSPGWDMDLAAVALGVSMVEKTLTLDPRAFGPEHSMSVAPEQAATFVAAIRDLEIALGGPRKRLTDAERKAKVGARRSAFLRAACAEGDILTDAKIEWRRPGDGITPGMWDLLGRRVAAFRNLPAGHKLALGDLA